MVWIGGKYGQLKLVRQLRQSESSGCLGNNVVERTIRPIALNRKNALFAGHNAGAQNWAIIASLIETCKLNNIEPHAYLTAILRAIVNGHK